MGPKKKKFDQTEVAAGRKNGRLNVSFREEEDAKYFEISSNGARLRRMEA